MSSYAPFSYHFMHSKISIFAKSSIQYVAVRQHILLIRKRFLPLTDETLHLLSSTLFVEAKMLLFPTEVVNRRNLLNSLFKLCIIHKKLLSS